MTRRVVTIVGRRFVPGAAYASAIPPPEPADGPKVPRRPLAFDPAAEWPDGAVVAELLEA